MQRDCRYFTGYKPCGHLVDNDFDRVDRRICNPSCPAKKIATPRILIIHLEAMGAVLRSTSLLPTIRRKWPECHITWVTQPLNVPMLLENPFIDRVLKCDTEGLLALSTLSFDYAFCIDKSLQGAGLLRVPYFIQERRGFGVDPKTHSIVPINPEAQYLYGLGLSNREKFFENKKPETQLICEALNLEYGRDGYVFHFSEDEEKERQKLETQYLRSTHSKFRNKQKITSVIGLNTGSSETLPYKKWSVEGWVDCINRLQHEIPEAKILLLGGPQDTLRNQEIFEALKEQDSKRIENLQYDQVNGLTDFQSVCLTPTTAGLRRGFLYMSLCDVVITGDSLGLHMAIALKKWVVAWFGPTCAHEIDFFNRGEAIKSSLPCSPCWKRHCNIKKKCRDQVDWTHVVTLVRQGLLHRRKLMNSSKILNENNNSRLSPHEILEQSQS